uniref:Uncharacterized protein n=1 Tax=Arundo donax TaxID=35708 RepID=A0A0A9QDM6_ARUDO
MQNHLHRTCLSEWPFFMMTNDMRCKLQKLI